MCNQGFRTTVAGQNIIENGNIYSWKKKKNLGKGNWVLEKERSPSRLTGIRIQGSQFICFCLALKPFISWPYLTSSIGLIFHHSQTPRLLSESQLGWYCCLKEFSPTKVLLLVILRPSHLSPLPIYSEAQTLIYKCLKAD